MKPRSTSQTAKRAVPRTQVNEIIFVMMFVFLVGGDIFSVAIGGGPITTGLKTLMLLPLLIWVGLNLRYFLRGMLAVPEITAMVALVVLSIVWSHYPNQSIRHLVPLVVTTATAMTIGSKLSMRMVIIALATLAAIAMLSSVLAVVTIPSARGIPPWDNAWRGAFSHKNGLGSSSMFMLIYATSAAFVCEGRLRRFFTFIAILAAFLLFMSESRTSQGIALLSMGALMTGIIVKRRVIVWSLAYAGFIMGSIALIYSLLATGVSEPLFDIVGRDVSISGRLPLWEATWPYVLEKPWVGYGYQSFWNIQARPVIEIARDPTVGYLPFYSHSGFIELLLNAGMVGTLLFLILILRLMTIIFFGLKMRAARTMLVPALVILIAFILRNILESSILSPESLSWIAFVMIATKVGALSRAMRRAKPVSRRSRTKITPLRSAGSGHAIGPL